MSERDRRLAITDQEFAAMQARLLQRRAISDQLDSCLREIRVLQLRRCRLEARLRQMHREASERVRVVVS